MGILVNVDNGGTFTDLCVTDGQRVVHAKTPTTPHDLTRCFVDGLRLVSERLYGEADLSRLLRETDHLRYSTTSGTNAVVERKGDPVALLVDAGAEDNVYGTTSLVDPTLWRAMVPHRPVGIAIDDPDAVDQDEFTTAVNSLLATNPSRIVVALRSARAEHAIKALLLERYPRHLLGAVPFTLSHELVHDPDDARRTLTAVVNSYLHPGMEHFLYGAEKTCKSSGLARPLLIFRNDGDSARVAKTTALKTWGSGPRGGLEGGLAYADLYDADVLVCMDVGGTTTDVSVVVDKKLSVSARGRIDSALTSFPIPELRSVGLGGSSVVRVADGRIEIGPRSVGAAPGPACFGRGGTDATLTDALLLAGILDPDRYLGGDLKLDASRAERALQTHVGEPLSLSAHAAAVAVLRAFEQQAGAAVSAAITAAGRDPADATLLAFGGAGPVVASGIARAAGISRVIVPHLSAVFSAFGIGFSGIAHEYSVPLPGTDAEVSAARDELLARARRDMFGEGVQVEDCRFETRYRHLGSGVVLDEVWPNGAPPANGCGRADQLVVRASHDLPTFTLHADERPAITPATADGTRRVRVGDGAGQETELEVAIHRPEDLRPGTGAAGPAIVTGDYLTCWIEPGWRFRVSSNSDLILEAQR
ncbi:hydantoinase/oxoprolinase family protein [Pseudonocardia thermophila]|jgi:N-methylhydantoinase A/acetone carboxylase, beta subunit|uniref:hydantoinase/oxoprolinase family protein n=1 Tax=Pseudonocardia thermophila TaxID=1848 RepID=UPI00248D8516|nr:hydantoinase/oxoprolinase family protein [Pseudonocardia thermophila]